MVFLYAIHRPRLYDDDRIKCVELLVDQEKRDGHRGIGQSTANIPEWDIARVDDSIDISLGSYANI